ncbi:hypothetical protein BGZ99_001131 [Dissophora globulifera]|uniref:CRAL-TRIO domain-containing protein n=1 Tax=Dissophora globulifera TaxID=979702 RepID=A0A9P6UX24_9FUNG|nr:hypothetical protein BGZ99_001131 [Dissophora globulifera]
MAVPDSSPASHQPLFTPSPHCRLPAPPAPLSDSQIASLDALRSHIHDTVVTSPAERAWTDDACLLRYLRARKWSLADAKVAVRDTLRWRKSFNPMVADRDVLWTETASGKIYVSGFDIESRPLLYMKPRHENTSASPAQIRHLVFHLEVAIALMPKGVDNLCIIIDFEGSSMTKNPGVGIAREILYILGNHYPEHLGKAYMLNAPWFFFPFYKLISPFIDPVTKGKLNFADMKKQSRKTIVSTPSSTNASEVDLSSSTATSTHLKTGSSSSSAASTSGPVSDNSGILDTIPHDMLEEAYGGSSNYVYNREIYWEAAEKALAHARSALEQEHTSDSQP